VRKGASRDLICYVEGNVQLVLFISLVFDSYTLDNSSTRVANYSLKSGLSNPAYIKSELLKWKDAVTRGETVSGLSRLEVSPGKDVTWPATRDFEQS